MASTPARQTPASQKEIAKEVWHQLELLGGKLTSEDDIIFAGDKLVIPAKMSLEQANSFIQQRIADEENTYSISRVFKFRPFDGARATGKAIKERFGFTMGKTIRTIFGDRPPEFRDIDVDFDQQEQVPWGAVVLPFLEKATMHLGGTRDPELGPVFAISAECKRKDRFKIEGLFRDIEENLRTDSIYRGKAINGADTPGFVDVRHVNFDDVVYTQEVMQQLEGDIWSRIRYAEQLKKLGQRTKRSVLLKGPFGTGKSLAAVLTAQVCIENGWTFLMCRPGHDNWQNAFNTGRIYGPSVVFIEDIDILAQPGSGVSISQILDQFDGVIAKGANMIVVLTTNYAERIHKAMLRPGRLDSVIHIGEMDRPGVERLARRVIGTTLATDTDFDRVFAEMTGFMPAYVREAFDRAVGYSVSANRGEIGPIGTDALVMAARSLRPQLDLMEGASDKAERIGIDGALGQLLEQTVSEQINERLSGAPIYDEDDELRGYIRTN